jgi:hypothetical protein
MPQWITPSPYGLLVMTALIWPNYIGPYQTRAYGVANAWSAGSCTWLRTAKPIAARATAARQAAINAFMACSLSDIAFGYIAKNQIVRNGVRAAASWSC